MKKYLLSLLLITSLVAGFYDDEGEEFPTNLGKFVRSPRILSLEVPGGRGIKPKIYSAVKGETLDLSGRINGILLEEDISIDHSITPKALKALLKRFGYEG
jgi:hypothetical protein